MGQSLTAQWASRGPLAHKVAQKLGQFRPQKGVSPDHLLVHY